MIQQRLHVLQVLPDGLVDARVLHLHHDVGAEDGVGGEAGPRLDPAVVADHGRARDGGLGVDVGVLAETLVEVVLERLPVRAAIISGVLPLGELASM